MESKTGFGILFALYRATNVRGMKSEPLYFLLQTKPTFDEDSYEPAE